MSGRGYFWKVQLTWVGQDYYSTIKNETIWNKTKHHLQSKALTLGEVGFDMIINVSKLKAKELLGIPLG